jgi:aminopeptidase N
LKIENTAPKTIRLADYMAPNYLAPEVELHFDLFDDYAMILSRVHYVKNSAGTDSSLDLAGQPEELVSIALDGVLLGKGDFETSAQALRLTDLPDEFDLEITTRSEPQNNKTFEGLYLSSKMFSTQCEAEGFRKITFHPDRPDVMGIFTTTITADKTKYPVLLANGNLIAEADLDDGRHLARWHDPFNKPSYLFALVAGDLGLVEDSFTTMTGREIAIKIYTDKGDEDKTAHALDSLKRSMKWDEEVYGREYDLDLFMIVAVADFNMGAMENKGLNIFNSAAVLTRSDTATDADYQRVEGIVAHEYFHNWSGNRVTLRDWFQLSLKEGFTVFRDQGFSADMNSKAVKRIEDVRHLRAAQFVEDAGPMSHPVRPESFIKIDNFYTLTIYEKGAEVVGMMHTLLGAKVFRQATDLYFDRNDGKAVTCEDFVLAMEEVSGRDLTQFRRWYSNAGTPRIRFDGRYDEGKQTYTLTLEQIQLPSPGQDEKLPLHIPVAIGLIDDNGEDMLLRLAGEDSGISGTRVLDLTEPTQEFTFVAVDSEPVPSVLRGFSAPCIIDCDIPRGHLLHRLGEDSDGFNRWDAGQTLALDCMKEMVSAIRAGESPEPWPELVEAFGQVLGDTQLDCALAAETLIVPSESYLGDNMDVVYVDEIATARNLLRKTIGEAHREAFLARYESLHAEELTFDATAMGRRRLRHVCLGYLGALEDQASIDLVAKHYENATNMTEEIAAFALMSDVDCPERTAAIETFRSKWENESLVMNKWFVVQAMSSLPGVLDEIKSLWNSPHFDENNPNKVRSLLSVFAANQLRFHEESGAGYDFVAEKIVEIDGRNPQLAARLIAPLAKWRRFDDQRQVLIKAALTTIFEAKGISDNSYEVAKKSLEG